MRGPGNLLADHAVNLGQLLHQVLLRLQPAGRVHDAHVGGRLDGPGQAARWATLAGSLLGSPLTISVPERSAQMLNCSTAAARNVSAAPSTTFFPDDSNMWASLAIDVVLPHR